MIVNIPDNDPIEVPGEPTVAELRRSLLALGFSQVEGAQATTDENGDVTFSRQTGGAKAGGR